MTLSSNPGGIGARLDDKVILKLALTRAVIDKIDSRINLLVPDASNPFFAAIARKATVHAERQGMSTLLADSHDSIEHERDLLTHLQSRQVEGLIVCPIGDSSSELRSIVQSGAKVVVVDRWFADVQLTTVTSENEHGAFVATSAILEKGHRRIGCLQGRPGTSSNERIDVDLNAVISDVFGLLEHQFEVGKIKVRRELAEGSAMVLGIEHQLQQVFLNLFLNARDAMPRGGWLSVTTRIDGDRILAEVADTGSGIPSEHLARIYDPFFTTKAMNQGTGLGLSITYGIVREHEGSIDCESQVGQGTRFVLSLPLARTRPALATGH